MRAAVALVRICSTSSAVVVVTASSGLDWEQYKDRHGKKYSNVSENSMRKSIFLESRRKIGKHNDQLAPKFGHFEELNQFSDWTPEELSNLRGTKLAEKKHNEIRLRQLDIHESFGRMLLANGTQIPDELDWRQVPNRVTKVGDQAKDCLADCARSNETCQTGGLVADALVDVQELRGLNPEEELPYKGIQSECKPGARLLETSVKSEVQDFRTIEPDEKVIKRLVATFGPVASSLDPIGLDHYRSEIYADNSHCNQDALSATKPVLIVGYGKDKTRGDYWIIKNSWGEKWGERGYFQMTMHQNVCGIAQLATIPFFVTN